MKCQRKKAAEIYAPIIESRPLGDEWFEYAAVLVTSLANYLVGQTSTGDQHANNVAKRILTMEANLKANPASVVSLDWLEANVLGRELELTVIARSRLTFSSRKREIRVGCFRFLVSSKKVSNSR